MLRDEEFYSDPYEFNPDRFIHPTDTSDRKIDSTELSASAGDPKSIVFGFGRRSESQRHPSLGGHRHCDNRICPGLHLADSTIWLTIACVLASFDILPPVDPKTGDVMVPEGKFVSGFTVYVHSSSPPKKILWHSDVVFYLDTMPGTPRSFPVESLLAKVRASDGSVASDRQWPMLELPNCLRYA